MHTLKHLVNGNFDVVFKTNDIEYPIKKNLKFDVAIIWVNYLNGGDGSFPNSDFYVNE